VLLVMEFVTGGTLFDRIVNAGRYKAGRPRRPGCPGRPPCPPSRLKLSVGGTCPSDLLEIEGLLTRESRPGRTFGESVGGILETDSSDWSNGIRHHIFDTRLDTEFNTSRYASRQACVTPLISVIV